MTEKTLNSISTHLLQTTTDSVIVICPKGIIQYANPATPSMFGYDITELEGKDISVIMTPEDAVRHSAYLAEYNRTGKSRILDNRREVRCVDKYKNVFYADLVVTEIIADGAKLFQGMFRDISEHKRKEQQLGKRNRELTQSNNLLERFAYISAHDLRSPLRSLSGLVQNFTHSMESWSQEGEEPDHEMIQRCASLISECTAGMSRTIDATLKYCRAGSNLSLDWHSLDSIIKAAMVSAKPNLDESGVYIDKEKANIKIHCDKSQLIQVFYNLIINAIQYNDKDYKEIRIEAYRQGDDVIIHVGDNGIGIPEDQQQKVFELFQRLNNTGSGVGGAIVHRIIQGHGGDISIDSIVGQGTTFNIKLPIKDIE